MRKIMEFIKKLNNIQKTLILLFVFNIFSRELYEIIPDVSDEDPLWYGFFIVCIIGIILFQSKNK